MWGLVVTVILGVLFTACQAYEYVHAGFKYAGHIYGSTFFMATGFHGAHVIIGTLFLTVCLFRALAGHFTPKQHFGFEAAAWYWHFVDVVWLFLFTVHLRVGRRHAAGALTPACRRGCQPPLRQNAGRNRAASRAPAQPGAACRPNCRALGDRRVERDPRHAWLTGHTPSIGHSRRPQGPLSPLRAGRTVPVGPRAAREMRSLRTELRICGLGRRAGGVCHIHPGFRRPRRRAPGGVQAGSAGVGARCAVGRAHAAARVRICCACIKGVLIALQYRHQAERRPLRPD